MGVLAGLMFFSLMMALAGLWIYAIVDVVRSEFKGENDKLIWLLLVILLPFVGTILYFTIGKDQKTSGPGTDLV